MTNKSLKTRITACVAGLIAYALLGVLLKSTADAWYGVYKDLIPVAIAVPGAYLGYAFQRRMSYLQALRDLWNRLIPAVQLALQYTYLPERTANDFAKTMASLSTVIDSLRGVFSNVPKPGTRRGLYPYENLKDIYEVVRWLDYDKPRSKEEVETARMCIDGLWREMHAMLLIEFDRHPPIVPVTKFLGGGCSVADKLQEGTLCADDLRPEKRASDPDGKQVNDSDETPAAMTSKTAT